MFVINTKQVFFKIISTPRPNAAFMGLAIPLPARNKFFLIYQYIIQINTTQKICSEFLFHITTLIQGKCYVKIFFLDQGNHFCPITNRTNPTKKIPPAIQRILSVSIKSTNKISSSSEAFCRSLYTLRTRIPV